MKSLSRVVLVAALSLFTFSVAFVALAMLSAVIGLSMSGLPRWAIGFWALGLLLFPAVAASFIAKRLLLRYQVDFGFSLLPSWARSGLAAGYLATLVLGVPAVQTTASSWAVSEYKRLKASGSTRVWSDHPYIATYLAIPVVPGIVVTYHEYQLNGLYGFGGFQVYLWYGVGVRPIGEVPFWVS